MRRVLCLLCLVVCAVGFISLATPSETLAAETIQRTVRGTVIATNTAVDPQTVIVKVMLPSKEELIVGARVPADTKITRGTRATELAKLKVGEAAELTYLKSPDGLIARSIHVR
jgi:Fe-S-cluster-containing hydrogenase component 2